MLSDKALRMVFVMDPPEVEDIDASTTFVLILEAQKRGHHVFYVDPADLCVIEGEPAAVATPIVLRRIAGDHVMRGESRLLMLDRDADVIFQRTDPPVDGDFVTASQILGICRRARVYNRPESVVAFNEKLFAIHYREFMPPTTVSRRIADLLGFMEEMGGEMIVKPLDGKGGEGIFHVAKGERNMSSILEQVTAFETRWVMAQRYLPQIREGDKRILLLDGDPLGAVLRVPADREVRANLHVGGRAVKSEIDAADRRIIERLGPDLSRAGLFFVGIDVIGGLLTEINVTSPTGVQEINRLDGVCLEALVIDRVEVQQMQASLQSS